MDQQMQVTPNKISNLQAYQAFSQIENQKETLKAKEGCWKAYLMSVLLPPIGIYYFIKYFFFADEDNAKMIGILSIVLTAVSLVLNIWMIKMFFNQSINNVKNNQNLNMFKELITPENQNSLRELLQ